MIPKKDQIFFIFLIMILLILLSSCNRPDLPVVGPTATFELLPTAPLEVDFYPLPTPMVNCHPDLLEEINGVSPIQGDVVDLAHPILNWSDPNNCQFLAYRVSLQYTLDSHNIAEINYSGEVDFPSSSYTIPDWVTLPPGEYVTWRVIPIIARIEGPEGESQEITGPFPSGDYFFTGPGCQYSNLIAPELDFPINGETVGPGKSLLGTPEFIWFDRSDCLPDYYQLEFFLNETGAVPDQIMVTGEPFNRWKLDQMLDDGAEYYWRAAGVVDGQIGPYSEYGHFLTSEIGEGQPGVIAGFVWADRCDNPIPRDNFPADYDLPDGCQIVDGNVLADGIMDPGEDGIPGVKVRIQDGACPPPEPGTMQETGIHDHFPGEYYQFLPTGTYCVYVDGTDPGNALFRFGDWSYPEPLGFPMQEVVISRDGEVVDGINFGWDETGYDLDTYGSISGVVWYDMNGDGVIGPGEPELPGKAIVLAGGDCGEGWEGRLLPSGITSSQGQYTIPDLAPGDYCLILNENSWSTASNLLGPGGIIDVDLEKMTDVEVSGILEFDISGIKDLDLGKMIGVDKAVIYETAPRDGISPHGIHFNLLMGEQLVFDIGWVNWPLMIDKEAAACREGADPIFPVVRYYTGGDIRYLIARLADNSFWVTTDNCWVEAKQVEMFGDPTVLPIYNPPPTPLPADTQPPSIHVSHSPGSPSLADTVTITATASDDHGVVKISIWTSKVHPIYAINPQKTCNNKNQCSINISPIGPGESIHYYAIARDAAGNQTRSSTGSYSIPH